ncbi:MAG: VWA domain-containing protein [Methylococcus sp.]|nr:VWA domain-containing protein [Methylococcus sp.]
MSRLRLCHTPADAYPPPPGGAPESGIYGRLSEAVRRHLSPSAASILAEPVASPDGLWIDWYSGLAGQPVPLLSLPAGELRRIRNLLEDRLQALRALADRLNPADPALAQALRQAATYPDETAVYVIDGQPVLTFWGYGILPKHGSARTAASPASSRRARWPWALLAGLFVAGGLGWAATHFSLWRWPPWGPDYAAMLAGERAEAERLRGILVDRQSDLARSLGQCALQARLDMLREEQSRLAAELGASETELANAIEICRAREGLDTLRKESDALNARIGGLQNELAAKLEKCGDGKLSAAVAEAAKLRGKLASLQSKLADKLARCGKKPPLAKTAEATPPPAAPPVPESSPKPVKAAEGLPPCPGERPPEDAPDVAIVLDASGSMRIPSVLDGNAAQLISRFESCMQSSGLLAPVICADLIGAYESITQAGRGPTRLMAAQRAVNNVVGGLPADVDVGMVVLEDCPQASDYGMYDGAHRGQLLQRVNGLIPRKGTPLGNGIVQAANKVDGVRAPAVMVVVSDGKDSCNADPCAIAAAVKAARPKLKINVVDIVGDGAVGCIARATGGDVLTPQSGMSLDQMVRQAAKDAEKPAHCK